MKKVKYNITDKNNPERTNLGTIILLAFYSGKSTKRCSTYKEGRFMVGQTAKSRLTMCRELNLFSWRRDMAELWLSRKISPAIMWIVWCQVY